MAKKNRNLKFTLELDEAQVKGIREWLKSAYPYETYHCTFGDMQISEIIKQILRGYKAEFYELLVELIQRNK